MKSRNLFLTISLFFVLLAQISFPLGAINANQDDSLQWTKKTSPVTKPGPRTSPTMAYDIESEVIIFTAGTYRDPVTGKGERTYNEDTWTLGASSKKQTSDDAGFSWIPFLIAIFVAVYHKSKKRS